MRRFLRTILELAARPGNEPLSARMFHLVTFFTGLLCVFVFWLVNLFEPDVPRSANLVVIGLGVVALGLHWESRKGRRLIAVLLVAIVLAMDFMWFAKGGFRGNIPLFYPTLAVLPLILYTNWRRWLAVGLIAANFGAVWLLTGWFPNWIIRLKDPREVDLDIASGVFFNCLALALIFAIVIYNYHREQQAIAASEEKYRQLFENMTVGFALHEVICDATGRPADYRYLAVNPAFEKLTGIPAAVIVGKTIREVKPDTELYWIEVFGSVALTGVPRAYVNFSRELGRYYDTWTFQPAPGQFAVMFSDVTEKRLAEIKIQQQARLLDEAKDAISVIGLKGEFTYVNEAWAKMHGCTKEELIGQHLAVVHTPEQFKACEHLNDEVAQLGRVQAEVGHKRKDGSTFPVWLSVSEVHDVDGKVAGFLGIANDISERKVAEEKIREQARLIDEASESIVVRDLNGVILLWNRGAEKMLGWSAAEAVGQKTWQLGKYEFREFDAALTQVLEKGAWTGDFSVKTKEGRLIEVESRWTLLRDDQGRPQKILSISHDITVQKKMEAQLLRAERLQTIGTLSSGVAHDLNNIFAPVLVGLPMLYEEIQNRETRELLELMENSIRRGADIVRQLLLFGRGGEGKRLPVNIARPLRDVAKIIRETFPRDITLRVACPDDIWLVLGDDTQIYQVVLNLAVNARDAMPHGGTLALAAENVEFDGRIRALSARADPGSYVVLSVRDNGAGMAPEVLERIFEPFYTTKEIGKGTGLGLSVAVGVVESHGGFIHIQSTPGMGTEFKVRLPALPAADEAAAAKKTGANLPQGRNEAVLLVDDEPGILKVISKVLQRNGYHPLVAPNGTEAVKVFLDHAHEIRLVITDYSMPGMNGFTLAEAIKKLDSGVPVIIASGLGDALDEAKLRQSGIQVVLKKPFDSEILLNTLGKIFQADFPEI